MGMKDFKQWYYKRNPDYSDINNSAWFQDITLGACEHSERHQNRIYVFFPTQAEYNKASAKCWLRNISHVGYIYNSENETYRLDIMMNWKERRPSKAKRNTPQKLD